MNRIRLANARTAKVQTYGSQTHQKDKLLAYLKDSSVDSTRDKSLVGVADYSQSNEDNYRYKVKLLERNKRVSRNEQRRNQIVDDSNLSKIEKLEILNNLLTKKNHLLEENLIKLRQENKLLKKATYLVLQNKDVTSTKWRKQFEESIANVTMNSDIFPEIRNQREGSKEHLLEEEDSFGPEVQSKFQYLEKQNKKLVRKVQELEETLSRNHLKPLTHKIKSANDYDDDNSEEYGEDKELQKVLDEAITKIKAMEYELESYEHKNEYLHNELRNQKKMSEFNEKSYNKLHENQKKLLEDNIRLQKCYQDVTKDLERLRTGGFGPR